MTTYTPPAAMVERAQNSYLHWVTDPRAQVAFAKRVERTELCWNWTASVSVYGYGQFSPSRGVNLRAHRYSWISANGPVPDGLVLDHLCRNRRCVRPDHLQAVTNRTNVLRGTGITAVNSQKTECKWGHAFSENNTGVDARGRRYCRECRKSIDRRNNDRRKARGWTNLRDVAS